MKNKPYEPTRLTWHKSVVDNVRETAKAAGLSTEKWTDEELWNLYQDCYFCDDAEAEMLMSIREMVK